MKVYLISGLGADDWIYRNLHFPKGYKTQLLPWMEPEANETLEEYAHRLAEPVDSSKPFIICGVSFGGICAQEISKFLKPEKLILISTITSRKEKPKQMNLGSDIGLSQVMPASLFKWAAVQSAPVLGITDKEEVKTFKEMAEQYSPEYYKWAVSRIGKWKGASINVPTLRLHGDKDKVFPPKGIENAQIIEEGEHIMVMHQANEISEMISAFLKQ